MICTETRTVRKQDHHGGKDHGGRDQRSPVFTGLLLVALLYPFRCVVRVSAHSLKEYPVYTFLPTISFTAYHSYTPVLLYLLVHAPVLPKNSMDRVPKRGPVRVDRHIRRFPRHAGRRRKLRYLCCSWWRCEWRRVRHPGGPRQCQSSFENFVF